MNKATTFTSLENFIMEESSQIETTNTGDVTLLSEVMPTITLTLNTNIIDFGAINSLVPTERSIIATVQSNCSYNLYVSATDDFKSANEDIMNINFLKVKSEEIAYTEMTKNDNKIMLISNANMTNSTEHLTTLAIKPDFLVKPTAYSTSINFKASVLP